jgi:hypothetical protein
MIESFRARGIYPDHVTSLAEESLLWESYEPGDLPPFPMDNMYTLRKILDDAYEFSRTTILSQTSANTADAERESDPFEGTNGATAMIQEESLNDLGDDLRDALLMYIKDPKIAAQLHLNPQQRISVLGFHPVFRVAPRGQLLVEMVAQFAQRDEACEDQFGGVPLRGGSTVIAAADGTIRYVIAKPLISDAISQDKRREAEERRQQQQDFVTACDRRDPRLPWADDRYLQNRIAMTMNFAGLHSEIIR